MFRFLYPDFYEDSIFSVDYERLWRDNVRYLIFDIDNTIVPHYVPEPSPEVIEFFDGLKKRGFRVCILSNARHSRVELFTKDLNVPAVPQGCKPLQRGLNKAMGLISATPDKSIIIGDQVFTDIWCGAIAGIRSVLVKPVSVKDEWMVKLKRGVESIVINEYLKKKVEG